MKKLIFCIALFLFSFGTIVSVDTMMYSHDKLIISTTVCIWSIYALFVIATFIDMRSKNAQRLSDHNRRKVLKEYNKFRKEYQKRMKEGRW